VILYLVTPSGGPSLNLGGVIGGFLVNPSAHGAMSQPEIAVVWDQSLNDQDCSTGV